MKKLTVVGLVAVMVMAATAAMAIDNDWLVFIRASTDSSAKTGMSSAAFGVRTETRDVYAWHSPAASLGMSPEIDYSDANHPYTGNYADIRQPRWSVAEVGGGPCSSGGVMDWRFRLAGAAGANVYVTAWNQTGSTCSLDANPGLTLRLYESDLQGNKLGAAIWTFQPGVTASWTASSGIAGTANEDYFQKSYQLGEADSAGGAYQYFVLEACPEPSSVVAILSGLMALAGFGIRRKR